MRVSYLALLLIAVSAPASAADCSKEVLAAFQKQRTSKVFRVEFSQPSAEGEVHMVIDYMPPDRMLQTVTSPAMPGEQQTMLVGNRAFAGTGGAFEELLPQFTQSIVAEFVEAVGEPKDLGTFECVGNSKVDGQDFVAYRISEKAADGADTSKIMARTVYIDPTTGKPAYNIIAALGGTAPPALKVKYSYPTDVEIVAPTNAPVQKLH